MQELDDQEKGEEKGELEAMSVLRQALADLPFERLPGGVRIYVPDAGQLQIVGDRLRATKGNQAAVTRMSKPSELAPHVINTLAGAGPDQRTR